MAMSIDVFVSHHTNSSVNIVEAIVNKLEANGVRCWYAPRDTQGAYSKSITGAIDSCRLFLLILNKPASESQHVLSELELVFDRVSNNEDVAILPFHIADDMQEISREAQYYIRRQHWIDAIKPPMYRRIDELVEKIMTMLGREVLNDSALDSKQQTYTLVSKIPQTREVFLGRDELLQKINDHFQSGKRILFLEGIGGIGKSELAKQYALANRQKYDNILFLSYTENLRSLVCDPVMLEISGIAQLAEEDTDTFFMRKLSVLRSIANERTLLIIDNFDVDNDPDLKGFIEGSHNIIFTTRNDHPGYTTIKVNSIDNDDVVFEIFERNYGMSVDREDKPYLRELFKMVDYHTYTIELLAKQMEASFVSGKELLDTFKNGQLATQATESIIGRNSVKTAFDHIKSLFKVNLLSETEIQILRELSLVGHTGVLAKYYWKWSVSEPRDVIKKCVLGLVRRSWVRRENSNNGPILSLHPLVSEVVRVTDGIKPNAKNCRNFLDKMADDLYNAWYTPYTDNLSIADCVLSTAEYFRPYEFRVDDSDLLSVWVYFANFMWQIGRFEESINTCHTLYNTCYKICGEASMLTGFVAKALGGCYFNSRRVEESIKWYKQGLRSMQLSGVEENEDLAMSYEKVARCYTWEYERDFDKAEQYFQISHDIRNRLKERLLNGETVTNVDRNLVYDVKKVEDRIGENIFEMSRMYQANKNYSLAIEKLCIREKSIKEIAPENKSGLAYIYYDKGVCYYHLGIIEKHAGRIDTANMYLSNAEENLRIALESNMEMRGALAADTIENAEYLADTYAARGKFGEASDKYMQVLMMYENLFGKENEHICRIKNKMDFDLYN